jgi:asparagine synthase (glutamine-hydrolysing)
MRTNGFALFRGPDGRELAKRAAGKVQRYCAELVVGSGESFETGLSQTETGGEYIVAYALERGSGGLPLVHGFVDVDAGAGSDATGEFSLLSRESGSSFVGSRDRLGTRPLYIDERGSCLATDHRFFQKAPKLLPNGVRIEVGSMELTTSSLPAVECRSSLDECTAELSRMLGDAVRRRVRGRRKVAVSFSGGLDSSLIALIAAKETEVVLCSAYASGSRDKEYAKSAADSLGLELVGVELDRASVRQELVSMDLPFEATPMDKALWCIYSTTAREAAGHGAELIMLGQLADELFGGYMKYAKAAGESEEVAATMMRADVVASGQRAFIRDEEAVARFTEARFPFADERLAAFGLGVPVRYKIFEGERKLVLRKAALLLGLPGVLAAAPKKAAQYSSGVAKLVE